MFCLYPIADYRNVLDSLPKLLLYERNWLSRWKTSVLHEGEGIITNVQWRANLIAWANNVVRRLLTVTLYKKTCKIVYFVEHVHHLWQF